MARPRKSGDLLMNVPFRIMLTTEQKRLIDDAARLEGLDTSTWVRPILLKAAQDRITRGLDSKKKRRK